MRSLIQLWIAGRDFDVHFAQGAAFTFLEGRRISAPNSIELDKVLRIILKGGGR